MAEHYVCTLDTASQEKAEKELNEDTKQRLSALETLRKWLNDRKEWLRVPMAKREKWETISRFTPYYQCETDSCHLMCTRTTIQLLTVKVTWSPKKDSIYLLGFLRMKKFNQLETRKSIVKAWELKTRFPQWYKNFDPADSKIRSVISSGYYYPLPRRDRNGRKVIIMRYGDISTTTKEYGPDDILKGFITLHEHVIRDENVQVNGYVYFMDLTGFGMKHVTYSGVERFANGADCWMKAHCGRNKELHFYNGGQMFNVLYGLLKQAMPKKIQERVRNHEENLFTIYDYIDKSLLPDEYLPDDYDGPSAGPKRRIIDKYLEEVTSDEYRRYMAAMSDGRYFVEASKRPREEEQASFRPIVQ